MSQIDYSVVIRTLGNAGEKYGALLKSISELEPQPKEVIVVLPEGYEKPKEQLGWETFYFSKKGMVSQRMHGINKVKTKYALICDDDVAFAKEFVQRLHEPIAKGLTTISAAPLLDFLPPKGLKTLYGILLGATKPIWFNKKRYITVLRTCGYAFNRRIDTNNKIYYEAQSLPWTCFFADIDALKSIDFDSEIWLDMNGYSAYDDQTMFYKAWLNNIKPIVISDAKYDHLDAKTSTKNISDTVIYCTSFNRKVFWHRFIYSQEKNLFYKFWSYCCYSYRNFWVYLNLIFGILRRRNNFNSIKLTHLAQKKAKSFINCIASSLFPIL